jgi:hypothetical protein
MLALFCSGVAFAQDGEMWVGTPNTKPELVIRVLVVDKLTHVGISRALIQVKDNTVGYSYGPWQVNPMGVAVYVAAETAAIPISGTIEITAPNYAYAIISIEQQDLVARENDNRLFLPAFPIQWADLNQIPNSLQLMDLIAAGNFQAPVYQVRGPGGILYPNEAPAIYQYTVELERVYKTQ